VEAGSRAASAPADVLLVEDDPAVLDFLTELLAGDGLTVACARTAVEALILLETGPAPAILVTDINLAGRLSGLDLARSVAECWPGIRLLIMSGQSRPAQDQYPPRALFFTKPFAPGALIAVVRSSDW
jgi:DNA-binding NtrC family response regulator